MLQQTNKSDSQADIQLRTVKSWQQQKIVQEFVAKLTKPQINVVYYQRHNKRLSKVYLLPVFTRITITRISAIDLQQDFGILSGRLFITLRFQGIPKKYIEPLLNNLKIAINDSEQLKFCMSNQSGQSYINQNEETATFVRTMRIQAMLKPQVFLAPFQRLYLQIYLNFLPYFYEERNQKTNQIENIVVFRFNNMIHNDMNKMITVRPLKDSLKYGEYSIAKSSKFLKVDISDNQGIQITSNRIYHEDMLQSYENKQEEIIYTLKQASTISFSCMLYRHPGVSIITIFVPMWILGLITLMIFFMSESFDNRIINTATVYISFATYFQVIRSVLPKSSHISLMEIFVYCIISICIFAIGETMIMRSNPSIIEIHPFERVLFMISFLIEVISFLMVSGGLLFHLLILKPSYNKVQQSQTPMISTKIYFIEWENQELRENMKKYSQDIYYADTKNKILYQVTDPNQQQK